MDFRYLTTEYEKCEFITAWEKSFNRGFMRCDYSWIFDSRNHIYAIYDGNILVAGYCLIDFQCFYNNEIIKGALCNNVFVIREYQGLNLFIKLGQYVMKIAAEQGIKIAIAMPNQNAIFGHQRVGWTLYDKNHFLEKKMISQDYHYEENKNVQYISTEKFKKFIDVFNRFSKEIVIGRTFSVIKDAEYFHWRYFQRPSVDYKVYFYLNNDQIMGYVVYKIYQPLNCLHILDIEAKNENVFKHLLNNSQLFMDSCNLINVLGTTIYSNYFFKAGFLESTDSSNLIAYEPLNKNAVLLGDKVNIVFGDNEVF